MKKWRFKEINYTPLMILLVIIAVIFWVHGLGMLINWTPSIKQGIYIKESGVIHRGNLVALCLPEPYQSLALSRAYVMNGDACHGTIPLLKEVIAVPGDEVKLTEDVIQVNGRAYFFKTEQNDHLGRPLMAYPKGDYKNTQGYWFLGNNSPHSWDSRYWGPLAQKQIIYKVKPLIVF